jgi:hypothetical protein
MSRTAAEPYWEFLNKVKKRSYGISMASLRPLSWGLASINELLVERARHREQRSARSTVLSAKAAPSVCALLARFEEGQRIVTVCQRCSKVMHCATGRPQKRQEGVSRLEGTEAADYSAARGRVAAVPPKAFTCAGLARLSFWRRRNISGTQCRPAGNQPHTGYGSICDCGYRNKVGHTRTA